MKLSWQKRDPSRSDAALVFAIAFACAVAAALLYRWLHYPLAVCLFHRVTGLPCPSCGSTRAAFAFLRLDLCEAMGWNPLGALVVVGCVLFSAYALISRALNLPRPGLELEDGERLPLALLAGALLILNWVYLVMAGV